MARLNLERSLACLPIDVAVTQGQKNGVDPSLIGVFDKTLRKARQTASESAADPASSSRESRRSESPRPTAERTERDDRQPRDVAAEDAEDPAAAPAESSPSNDVEPDNSDGSAETTSEANDVDDPAASDETTDVAATAVPTASQPAFDETAAQTIEETVPEVNLPEQVSSDADGVESANQPVELAGTDTEASEAAIQVSTSGSAVDGTTSGAEAIDETINEAIGATDGDSGDATEPEAESGTSDGKKTSQATSFEKPIVQEQAQAGESPAAEAKIAASKEAEGDTSEKQEDKRRGKTGRGEKHGVATPLNDPQSIPAQADQAVPAQVDATSPQVPSSTDAGAPEVQALPDVAAVSDPGTTDSSPQTTASSDAVSPVESRSAAAQSPSAAGTGAGKGAGEAVDSAKFVQRVANAFAAMGQRSGPVRLKLYPPELGSLRMEITVKNGALSARVEAETATAKTLLLDNLPVLRERLAEQGIKVERFDVGFSDQPQGGPSERSDQGGRSFRHTGQGNDSRTDNGGSAQSVEPTNAPTFSSDGRLDVFI